MKKKVIKNKLFYWFIIIAIGWVVSGILGSFFGVKAICPKMFAGGCTQVDAVWVYYSSIYGVIGGFPSLIIFGLIILGGYLYIKKK
ncbi:MAG: hypothetical protein AABY22_07410 [Nanoarchaeota archaeon]